MNKKIVEVCLSPDLGGLELCVVDFFENFSKKSETYICVAPQSKLDKYVDNENKFSVQRNKLFPFISAQKLAKFIDENKIDIIHFHWTRDIAMVVLAKLLSKQKPKIVQSRHMTMTRFKDDFYHKWLYKHIDMIHAVTEQVKEQLIRYIPSNIRPQVIVSYLGVNEVEAQNEIVMNLKKKHQISNEFIVGIIGRIEEAKGQYLLIEAMKDLQKLNIKVLIIGDAMDVQYLKELKEKVQVYGLEKRTIFTGFTKNINEYMQLCDVTVLATKKETFGLVVIESMVNKTPVIAAKSGGPLEIINDGVDGLFFNGQSSDLAEKIELIYKDSELKNRLCENGYTKVLQKFNKSVQMREIYGILNAS